MAAALPPWPHAAAEATETRVRIRGRETIHVHQKPRDHPFSVRLHGNVILSHGSRRAVRKLDHRMEVPHVAAFTCIEACTELIHGMLAEAPATSQYDLAAGNWPMDSTHTPLGIATVIARYVRDEFDDEMGVPVPGLEFDVHLPELRVTLVDSELCLCAICLLDLEAEDENDVTLPCSHLFHRTCVATWFHQASTCPTCRHEIVEERFSILRSAYPEELMDIGADDEPFIASESQLFDDEDVSEDELLFLDDGDAEDENQIDFLAQDEDFIDSSC